MISISMKNMPTVTEDTFKAEVITNIIAYASRRYARITTMRSKPFFRVRAEYYAHTTVLKVFAPALGDYGFIFRTEDYAKLEKIASWIMKLKETSVL